MIVLRKYLLCLLLLSAPTLLNAEIKLFVEQPVRNGIASGTGLIAGWAVSDNGIASVEVSVDGIAIGQIPYGGSRADVGAAFPEFPDSENSGWGFKWAFGLQTPGEHVLTVKATDGEGNSLTQNLPYWVVRFKSSFIGDPDAVRLNQADIFIDEKEAIQIRNVLVEGDPVNISLRWDKPSQQFAIIQIETPGGAQPNSLPVADAGPDQTIAVNRPVTLPGFGGDSDGQVVRSHWYQLSGPPVEITGAEQLNASFTAPAQTGKLSFMLLVVDDQGATATDLVNIHIHPQNQTLITDVEASRFLAQSTFGPTRADIARVKSLGYRAWLNEQFAQPASLQLPYLRERHVGVGRDPGDPNSDVPSRQDAWWFAIVEEQDQLRQRVAFALSQIFVVSDRNDALAISQFGMADYFDMLARNAFGNYRDLMELVTLHPVMGMYLSMVQNEKADPERNVRPDENYARELMQLFTIGAHELNIDGSLKLDGQGNPVATYDQSMVEEYARVFTGWNFADIDWLAPFYFADRTKPMVAWEEFHDSGEKQLLGGIQLPAEQTARQDLDAALDSIFKHPNVAPFVSKQLIQRLVTSNPTPAYVQRVAEVFENDGDGVRGNLQAVVRAILLDSEARRGHIAAPARFGKLREPVLRLSHLWRAFNASRVDGGEFGQFPGVFVYTVLTSSGLYYLNETTGQALLRAPSVFNFFRPDHSPAGPVRDAGMVAPEFQILTENNMIATDNMLNYHAQYFITGEFEDWTHINIDYEAGLADQPEQLLDHLNALLLSGAMSGPLRQAILHHLNTADFGNDGSAPRSRAKDAISLIISSPEYQIQR